MTNYVSHRFRFIAVAAFCLVFAVTAAAQFSTSRITGTVMDSSGAVIPGATVTVTNEATGLSETTTTSVVGTYAFDAMEIGMYTVEIETEGFKKFVSKNNKLSVTATMTVNATLEVGQTTEVVEVTSSAIAVVTDSSGNFGNLLDSKTLQSMPNISGRGNSPLNLIWYQPGVGSGCATGGCSYVNGSRDRSWNYTLDGIDVNESTTGGSETTPLRLNPNQLSEFRVVTGGQTAEYGRNSGGQVTMVSKSGTSDYHGDLSYSYRSAGMDASTYADNWRGRSKPKDIQHIINVGGGGPVIPDGDTFFFANFQRLRAPKSGTTTSTVFTQEARTGNFRYVTSACPGDPIIRNAPTCVDATGNLLGGITSSSYDMVASDPAGIGLDPAMMAYINLTPLPNDFSVRGDGLNTAGYTFAGAGGDEQDYLTVKIDHDINDAHRAWGRFSKGTDNTVGDPTNNGGPRYPGFLPTVNTNRSPTNLAIGLRSTPVSGFTNEFILGLNDFFYLFGNPDPNFATNVPFDSSLMSDPTVNGIGNARGSKTWQIVDNMTYVRGAHTFKGGVNFRFLTENDRRGSVAGANSQLSVTFSRTDNNPYNNLAGVNFPEELTAHVDDQLRLASMINEMLGRVGAMSQGFVANQAGTDFDVPGTLLEFSTKYDEMDFYIQDSWKIRPNFLIELGLRYEIKAAPSSNNRQILVPNQAIFAGAPATDALTWVPGKLWENDTDNFSPMVGFAWDPQNDGKMSIRGNARIAYDRMNPFAIAQNVFQSMPGQVTKSSNTSFGNEFDGRVSDGLPSLQPTFLPADGLTPAAFGNTSINHVFASDWEAPETYMWGLSFERDLGNGMVFDATYNGRYGKNLIGAYNANQVKINAFSASGVPGDAACTETFLEAFIYTRDSSVVGGDAPSCLMDALFSSEMGNGTDFLQTDSIFRDIYLNRNSVGLLASVISDRTGAGNAQMIALSGMPSTFFKSFPQYSRSLGVIDSNDYSHYHGLTLQMNSRMEDEGLTFNVNYTLSKAKDVRSYDPTFSSGSRLARSGTGQDDTANPWDNFNRRLNYGRSDFDRRHALKGMWIYDLPFGADKRFGSGVGNAVDNIIGGWQFSGLLSWTSGRPFTVFSEGYPLSQDTRSAASCAVADCSKIFKDVHIDPGTGWVHFFERGSGFTNFMTSEAGTPGNLGRNAFSGPSFFNVDTALTKFIRVTESQSLEIQFQMEDATNHSQWGFPTAEMNSSNFGRLLWASSRSRQLQFVAKYHF